jgi:hypothetical protein
LVNMGLSRINRGRKLNVISDHIIQILKLIGFGLSAFWIFAVFNGLSIDCATAAR